MTRRLHDSTGPMRPVRSRPSARAWFMLALYVVFLIALIARQQDVVSQKSLWDLLDRGRFLDWVLERVLAGLTDIALFIPLGFLVRFSGGSGISLARSMVALVSGLGLTAVIVGIGMGGFPEIVALAFPACGFVLGTWAGSRWLLGTRARLWLAPQMSLLLLLSVAVFGGLVLLGLEDEPLSIEATEVTSAEKRRFVELMRSQQQGRLSGVSTKSLRFSEQDVDLIVAWGLSLGSPRPKAKVQLGEGTGALMISVELPGIWRDASYFNFQGTAQCEVRAGELRFRFEKLQVGSVDLPRFALSLLSPLVASTVANDPDLGGILTSVESLQIEPGALEVVYREGTFREVAALLERAGAKPNVLSSTQAQILHLLHMKDQLPEGDQRFGALLETAFALARIRSQGGSRVNENRAAIYALGVLVGHHRFADLIGLNFNETLGRMVRRGLGGVILERRTDWPRHYLLSAALAQLSAETVSDAIGLLKEELDADEGGSGFSFSDLLADRAGTLFSIAATRDEQAALEMQERLSRGFRLDDFFPPAADLPDGINDPELQSQYGGVGGEGYRRVVQEIEQRLSGCSALR